MAVFESGCTEMWARPSRAALVGGAAGVPVRRVSLHDGCIGSTRRFDLDAFDVEFEPHAGAARGNAARRIDQLWSLRDQLRAYGAA